MSPLKPTGSIEAVNNIHCIFLFKWLHEKLRISWSPTVGLHHHLPLQVKPCPQWLYTICREEVPVLSASTHTRAHTVSGKTKTTTLGCQIFRRLLFLSIYLISLFSSPSLFIDTLDDDFSLYSELLNLLRCSCMFSWRVLGSCSVILMDWSADRVDLWCLFTGLMLRPATLRSPLLLAGPPLKREMKSQVRLFFCNCYDLCRTCFSIYKLVQLFKGFICWVLMNSLFYFVHRKYVLWN